VSIAYQQGAHLGLGLKDFQNRVLVSRLEEGSLAAASFQIGDQLCDIDGHRVTDKYVTSDHIKRQLKVDSSVVGLLPTMRF
jgi:hypothetical protein